jgi:hypothetical protein
MKLIFLLHKLMYLHHSQHLFLGVLNQVIVNG